MKSKSPRLFACGVAAILLHHPAYSAAVNLATPAAWEISAGASWQELNLKWSFSSTEGYDSHPLGSDNSDAVISPAVSIRRVLHATSGFTVRLGLGYQYAESSWSTGEHLAGEGPAELYTLDIASMAVSMHQLSLQVDVGWRFGSGWEAGFRAGPTLTIFDGEFSGSHETFQHIVEGENGAFVSGKQRSASEAKTVLGMKGEAFLRRDLGGSLFVELRGGYGWTDEAGFGSSGIGAKVDASSWSAGVSVGLRF